MADKKYLTLKGNLDRTPYGVVLKVYLGKELIEHCMAQEPKQWNKDPQPAKAAPEQKKVPVADDVLEVVMPDVSMGDIEERLAYWKKINPAAVFDFDSRAFLIKART